MDETPRAAKDRPRLAVVYGHRSLDLMQICEGARDWCDIVWLVDGADPSVSAVGPMLRKFGVVVDALAHPPREAAAALRAYRPDGLATFYDTGMEQVAAIAGELGVSFHSRSTALCLEDKVAQRDALRSAGLPTPRVLALPDDADRQTVERLGASIGYPAVLKPRRASGSWHTYPVADVRALTELWEKLVAADAGALMVEEYLPDGPPMPGGFEADYVSVETIAVAGRLTHLALTGRFPLAPPFRETGFFIPATVTAGQQAEILALAAKALHALGVRTGPAHTEIKLTPEGPRVIEVNGRIGGGVPEMLRLATGMDMMKLTMQVAAGLKLKMPDLPATAGVAYRFFFQPPASARRLIALDGLDRVKRLPGVESVILHHGPGTKLEPGHGTRTYLFAVVGSASDHAGVVAIEKHLRTEITAEYEHA
jgi:biotin carboxylase